MVSTASAGQPVRETGASKIKILLVDDTPENLVSLEAALDILGEELILARSGKDALRQCLENEFAAILLDVKMPDMDGFETAELIRSRPNSRHTPILFLTGYKSDEHLFRGYDLGAVDFLFKPIVPEILRSKVAVFVELSRKAELLREQATVLARQSEVLRKAEQQFRSLLEAAPDSMVICKETGEIVLVNSRTESLFGYDRSELLHRNIRMLVPSWHFQILPAPDEDPSQAPLQFLGFESEVRSVNKSGVAFPVEISLSPLQTDEGLWITSAIRDITERKRMEEERAIANEQVRQLNGHLEQLNTHLEERVRERTDELLRSNDELAQFAYVASHDLQEPLRTVSLYTELLTKRYGHVLKDDGQQFIQYIVGNSHRMEHLIRDLLDFSRLDARGAEHFTTADCNEAVREAIANLHVRVEEAGAKIDSEDLPSVQGDPIQLTRLFQNLLKNAIMYTKPGEAAEVHIRAVPKDAEYVFSVQDNGVGIDPQFAERIFGIFKRLHSRDTPGTGIGLAICKKIVLRHGGQIWVDSQAGSGATFYFTLPRWRDRTVSPTAGR
ncbi:MAG: response regulator [Bryobacteraceae bacterium]|nr:response regulator [Bryobacteraceae bacterium]